MLLPREERLIRARQQFLVDAERNRQHQNCLEHGGTSSIRVYGYVAMCLSVYGEPASFSLSGRFSTEEEVRRCAERLVKQIHRLRELSPLYELAMAKKRALASGVSPADETEGSDGFIWT